MTQGPNVKRLIVHRMSMLAIPAGSKNPGIEDGVAFLSDPGRIAATAREATGWVERIVALVKTSTDNPYGDDDEAIAGEILRKMNELKTRT